MPNPSRVISKSLSRRCSGRWRARQRAEWGISGRSPSILMQQYLVSNISQAREGSQIIWVNKRMNLIHILSTRKLNRRRKRILMITHRLWQNTSENWRILKVMMRVSLMGSNIQSTKEWSRMMTQRVIYITKTLIPSHSSMKMISQEANPCPKPTTQESASNDSRTNPKKTHNPKMDYPVSTTESIKSKRTL